MIYQNLLNRLINESKRIFGEKLTGVYLHGSMAMGCFNPDKSDIDVMIIVESDITDDEKMRFMNEIVKLHREGPEKGIEMSIVKRKYCKPFLYPTPFELHFSGGHLQWFLDAPTDYIAKMKGMDRDLAAHFTIIREYGVVLYGREIDAVFAKVPRAAYIDSIWFDIENAEEEINEDPVYIILNLCRVAAFLKENLIISKKQGGEWGLQNLPEGYRSRVSEALHCYLLGKVMEVRREEAEGFAQYMLQMMRELK